MASNPSVHVWCELTLILSNSTLQHGQVYNKVMPEMSANIIMYASATTERMPDRYNEGRGTLVAGIIC